MYTPIEEENVWVQGQLDLNQAMLCLQFAAGINRLNYDWIDPLLTDRSTYGSQTILDFGRGEAKRILGGEK